MHKVFTWIAYGAVIVILVLLLGSYAVNYDMGETSLSYPYGQSDKDKADALQAAFNDTAISSNIQQAGRYRANVTIGGSFSDSGFIGLNGELALVDISSVSVISQRFLSLVCVSNGREMEARYPYAILNKYDFVLLQPGITWYRSFMAGESPATISIEFEPQNADLRPLILDQENFDRYKSGQQFEPLGFMDGKSGKMVSYGGSNPVSAIWSTNVTLPDAGSPQKCYLILQNNGRYGDMYLRLDFKDGK